MFYIQLCMSVSIYTINLYAQAEQSTKMVVVTSVFLEPTNRQCIVRYFFTISETDELQVGTIWYIFSLQSKFTK